MKKTLLYIVALSLITTCAIAQTQPQAVKVNTQHNFLDFLNLSPEQKTKVEILNSNQLVIIKATMNNTNLPPEQRRAALRKCLDEKNALLKAILTPEQNTALEAKIHANAARPQATNSQMRVNIPQPTKQPTK